MNPFKILHIRKMIKEGRENPSRLAGEQTAEMMWGIVLVPIIICVLLLILFFIMGYTHLFGFSSGFFRFLFWFFLIPGIFVFGAIRKMIGLASRTTTTQAKKVVDAVATEVKK